MGIIDHYLKKRGFVKAEDIQTQTKAAGFMSLETAAYPEGKPDQDKIASYSTFIQAFRSLPWLYAGATALAIASVKPILRIYREVKDSEGATSQEEVLGEGINARIELPNPDLSYQELIQITVLNLALLGNQYWNLVGTQEKVPISKTNPPVEIWWVKPEQMQLMPDLNGVIKGYEFTGPTGQKKTLDPSEIIHFRLANPGSYFMGLGMMEPLTNTATLEYNATNFMRAFMENDGTPPFVFEHPGEPDETQRKRFWNAWDGRHKGPKRAGRAGMIWGGMKVTKLGDSVKDAQYPELRKMNREEILASLGVPPSVVGLLEYANYSNMEVQQKKFWEDAVMPLLGLIADKLTLRFAPLFDERYWFEFDYSNIKVLQEDEERRARVANLLISSGLRTPNQMAAQMFNAVPYEGGDQYYINFSLTPIGVDATAAKRATKRLKLKEPKSEPPDGAEIKASYWSDPGRKKLLWDNFDKRLSAQERAFEPLVEKYLKSQADDVKAKIESCDSPESVRADHVFDIEAEATLYGEKFENRYRFAFERAGEAGYHATKGKLWIPPEERRIKDDDTFTVRPEHLAKLKMQIEKAARFFNTTTWAEVKGGIDKALAENMTTEEMAQELWRKLDGRAAWEARRIASTEMTRTEGFGGVEGYKQNEAVDMKGWNCQKLDTSRDPHIEADGQEVGVDEDFMIDGEAMAWPGDDRASAGNVCGCRCSTYPIVGEL